VVENYHSVIFNSEYICVEIDRSSECYERDVRWRRFAVFNVLDIFVDM